MKAASAIILLAAVASMSAPAKDVIYKVGPFDRLTQSGSIDIVYKSVPDSTGIACYRSDKDFDPAIEIVNNKGRLSIKETAGHNLGKLPTLYVYSDYLSQVKSEGIATLDIHLSTSTPVLSVNLVGNGRIICDGVNSTDVSASITTGNGTIALRGECTEADFKLTGKGVIQADELKADNVKCSAMGTGSIGCYAVKNLDVRGIGTTKIYYRGLPEIHKVGGARLSPLPDSVPELQEAAEDEETDEQPTVVTADPEPGSVASEPEKLTEQPAEKVQQEAEEEQQEEGEEEDEGDESEESSESGDLNASSDE